ncbi:MAG TPA: hypothetical protein P5081_15895 [Phycisphaerae bacterium]|nr:hypothetical protein [Phycisphaerae bacterium]HRW54354.1 hypothetical protein [Phycisphaerae bacterium]
MTDLPTLHPPTTPNATPISQPVRENVAPDWDTFLDDIDCPLCGYNLRGLSEARCPECGGAFSWNDLLDPRRRTHDYLYEYHEGYHAASILRTMTSGILPWRFWRSVSPALPVRMARLRQYLGVILGAMILSFLCGLAAISVWASPVVWWASSWSFAGSPMAPWSWSVSDLQTVLGVNHFVLTIGIWFAATYAAMHLFGTTMRRRRIKTAHVFRCLVYSSDVFIWLAGLLMLLDCWEAFAADDLAVLAQYLATLVAILIVDIRLVFAFRGYLQFPRPFAVVFLTQVVAALVIFNAYMAMIWL